MIGEKILSQLTEMSLVLLGQCCNLLDIAAVLLNLVYPYFHEFYFFAVSHYLIVTVNFSHWVLKISNQ